MLVHVFIREGIHKIWRILFAQEMLQTKETEGKTILESFCFFLGHPEPEKERTFTEHPQARFPPLTNKFN